MTYLVLFSVLALSADPANLLVHPGFEASQVGMHNAWHWQSLAVVDESASHSGHQALRMDPGAVVVQRVSGKRLAAPGTFIASAWRRDRLLLFLLVGIA